MSQNLIALGLTSFFSDISSEMVIAVVPLFLTGTLGFSIIGFGLFEGAYQATNALFRVWGGAIADRRQRHKRTAATGYSISALTRLGLVASAVVTAVPAVPFLLADRVGKGLRTAPRDALISLSTAPGRLGQAFGIHRAFDTAGALLGPLAAFAVLAIAPGAFDAVFVLSACTAAIGVAIIWVFAQEKPQPKPQSESESKSEPESDRAHFRDQWREVWALPSIRPIASAAALLGAVTVSDAFIYLVIQRRTEMSARWFPLLFVGTAIVYLALAIPVGKLADRAGSRIVFLAGNALLLGLYGLLLFSDLGLGSVIAVLGLLGAYYAATDGVLAAMVAGSVPPHIRASGIAFVTVAIAAARMLSAATFGSMWQVFGEHVALAVFGAVLCVAIGMAARLLRSAETAGAR